MPSPHPSAIIEAQDLTFHYHDERVLDRVSFSIDEGEYLGIFGPNGSGKTTLLKLLLGLLEPSYGSIRMFGQPATSRAMRSRVGYVPQRIAQTDTHFPATVEEIVLSGRTSLRGLFHGWTKEDRRAVQSAMDQLEITDLRHRQIGRLSGGQRQRVFIARALASEPRMLILDEPTVGVDPASTEKFYTFLRELNERGRMTIVIVSHDLDVVAREVNSILCLNRTLVCHGSPRDILTPELLASLYGNHVKFIHHHHAR